MNWTKHATAWYEWFWAFREGEMLEERLGMNFESDKKTSTSLQIWIYQINCDTSMQFYSFPTKQVQALCSFLYMQLCGYIQASVYVWVVVIHVFAWLLKPIIPWRYSIDCSIDLHFTLSDCWAHLYSDTDTKRVTERTPGRWKWNKDIYWHQHLW